MMDINRIEEARGSSEVEMFGFRRGLKKCLLYNEEVCAAPRIRFKACRACVRVNPHAAAKNIFEKIKELAAKLFNLPAKEPGQAPPAS